MENKDDIIVPLVAIVTIAVLVAIDAPKFKKWYASTGGFTGAIDAAIDKWYEKDRAKCMEKAPVYGFTGEYRPYWDEDEHECIMITPDSIYKRLDERSIRRRLEE